MFYKDGQFNIKSSWGDKDQPKSLSDLEKESKAINNIEKGKISSSNIRNKDVMDILDNEVAKRILKDFKDEGGFKKKENPVLQSKPNLPLPKPAPSKDNDLLASMAGRLSKLETTCNNQREEIKEKAKLIDKLQDELSILKKGTNAEDILELKSENEALKAKINEMEKFLNDYGLKWVGKDAKDQKRDNFNVAALHKDIDQSKPIYKSRLPREIDMNIIDRRIEELNIIIANEGDNEIVRQNGAHVFKRKEPLHIAFYKDGLIIKGYPFYKYSSREAQKIIEDILDGYFPAVLKHKYPEGTLFKLIVKVEEDFGANIATKHNVNDLGSVEDRIFQPLSKEAFLNELPKEVIKNGKIIPVRDAIAKKLNNPGQVVLKETEQEGTVDIETSISEKEKNGQLSPEQLKKLITLKVRTESGKRTLIFKVLSTDSVAAVYKIIKDYSETKKFEIWGGYPPQPYANDDKKSLEDVDIYTDSVCNLRAL